MHAKCRVKPISKKSTEAIFVKNDMINDIDDMQPDWSLKITCNIYINVF